MYRKTHSKPRPDLFQELRKEFGIYFFRFGALWKLIRERYPRQIFTLMLFSILLSGGLAFTVMRVKNAEPLPSLFASGAVPDIGVAFNTGQALKEVLDLQNQINTVLHKDSLTAADSLLVKSAIQQLESIHHKLNDKPNE